MSVGAIFPHIKIRVKVYIFYIRPLTLISKKLQIQAEYSFLLGLQRLSDRGLVRGVSGVSIDTPKILEISKAAPKLQSVHRSKL